MHSNQSPELPDDLVSRRYRLLERLGGGSFAGYCQALHLLLMGIL